MASDIEVTGGGGRGHIIDLSGKPSLRVYTPITGTSTFVEDIAPIATDYSHTIRRLGGFWTATWKLALADIGSTLYDEWRSNRNMYHFVEQTGGMTTWEGSIEGIQPNDDMGIIDVTAYGYVHSIQNRYNSTTDTGTTDADAWLELLRVTDCPLITSSELQPNTLQCYKAGTDKVWDEMLKVVELGDGLGALDSAPWQLGVYEDRRLYYQIVPTTPMGYVRGGMRWRVDMPNDVINWVIVRYTDETGAAKTDITLSRNESVLRYERREERLQRSNLPTASASALCSAFLNEHAWPFMRAIGCGRDIQVYDSIGSNKARSPWVIQPGVYQDTTIAAGGPEYLSWMPDRSYFLVDEVVASAKGVQLRTSKWTETDALEAYWDYLADAPKVKKKKKKKRA